jgi:hypothetical protein
MFSIIRFTLYYDDSDKKKWVCLYAVSGRSIVPYSYSIHGKATPVQAYACGFSGPEVKLTAIRLACKVSTKDSGDLSIILLKVLRHSQMDAKHIADSHHHLSLRGRSRT